MRGTSIANNVQVSPNACSRGMQDQEIAQVSRSNRLYSVLSVKGKKVLHIDRNDHYGGYTRTYECLAMC
jgi:hypothetical protein